MTTPRSRSPQPPAGSRGVAGALCRRSRSLWGLADGLGAGADNRTDPGVEAVAVAAADAVGVGPLAPPPGAALPPESLRRWIRVLGFCAVGFTRPQVSGPTAPVRRGGRVSRGRRAPEASGA